MTKKKQSKRGGKLLLTVDKVRDLQGKELEGVAGGSCTMTRPSYSGGDTVSCNN